MTAAKRGRPPQQIKLPGNSIVPIAQARELLALVEALQLEEAIQAQLFEDFVKDEGSWPSIRMQLSLLKTAGDALRRMVG